MYKFHAFKWCGIPTTVCEFSMSLSNVTHLGQTGPSDKHS